MAEQIREAFRRLLAGQRWAALATWDGAQPQVSAVAYALAPEGAGLLLHLSRLAAHTRHLEEWPACSLLVGEVDDGRGDPQTLARLSLQARVRPLLSSHPAFPAARAAYLDRLPEATPRFEFADFGLFQFEPLGARLVLGFGSAHSLDAEVIRRWLRDAA